MGKWHLAVDIGSESGRVIAGRISDGRIETHEIHRFITQDFQLPHRRARNFYRFHEEILKGMQLFADAYGRELASIGVDGWGGDFVLLDRKGNISRLPSSYRDNMYSDVATIVEKKFGRQKLYSRCGNQEMPTDTLHQILRLQQDGEPSIDSPHAILFVADAFQYMLGANVCCEHSLASYCRLFNRSEDDWDLEVLKAFNIPETIKTKVSHAGEHIGFVKSVMLRNAGLNENVPIITPCSHDTACAALAVADLSDEWCFLSSGTWSLLGFETAAPILTEKAWRNNFSNSTMPLMTNMFKKNITGTWIIQQCRDHWKKYGYSDIVEMADQAKDLNCFFDVDATEFYSNDNMPLAISDAVMRTFNVFVDPEDVGTIARICFQSSALKYDYYLGRLLDAADKKISKMYVVGGGSKNELLNQFTANAVGYPVYTGVFEGSSIGNILIQAYGCGELKSKQEMRQIVINSFPQTCYSPDEQTLWKQKRDIFLNEVPHKTEF